MPKSLSLTDAALVVALGVAVWQHSAVACVLLAIATGNYAFRRWLRWQDKYRATISADEAETIRAEIKDLKANYSRQALGVAKAR